jgi:DNA-binding transcriptional LysR family regulator
MLVAFDAAARTGSFSAAARELNLTQGAISRQIQALENQLDVLLFKRAQKSVCLTEAGNVYAQEIQTALQTIRTASLNAITNPLSGTLNLAILPTFGTRWLMPRFPAFLQENPDITVNFVTKLSPFDFHKENLHAAIHYGLPDWRDTSSTFLMGEQVIPVCSAKLLKQNRLQCPADLAAVPLLHLASRPDAWDSWFELNKVTLPKEQGMHFEQFSIVAQATVAGLGAALLPKFLIQSELDRGELMVILDRPLESRSGYYLVTPADKSGYAPVVAFRDWLLRNLN